MWSPPEAAAYVTRLGPTAAQALHVPPDPDPPTLTVCTPYYDDTYELHARLQVTFDVCGADTDGTWGDDCASTTVDADSLPTALQPLASAPAALRAYWDEHPMDDHCGWTRVPSPGPARDHLEALARKGKGTFDRRQASGPSARREVHRCTPQKKA